MRKIVVMMSISVDGFMEGPNRELDWQLVDDELHEHFNEELATMGAFLDGRVTYELMAAFWPTADRDPASTGAHGRVRPHLAGHAQARVLHDPGAGGLERHHRPRGRPRGDRRAEGATRRGSRGRAAPTSPGRSGGWTWSTSTGSTSTRSSSAAASRCSPPADTRVGLRLVETRTFGNGVVLLRYQAHRTPRRGRTARGERRETSRPRGPLVSRWPQPLATGPAASAALRMTSRTWFCSGVVPRPARR